MADEAPTFVRHLHVPVPGVPEQTRILLCPYTLDKGEEHSPVVAMRAGHPTGVCEDHICRGHGTCMNAMRPYGKGSPFCTRAECQPPDAATTSSDAPLTGAIDLSPDMWYYIAQFLPPADVAYLLPVSYNTFRGVGLFVNIHRRKRARESSNVSPAATATPNLTAYVQTRDAAFTSRSRMHDYMARLTPKGLSDELNNAFCSGSLGPAKLAVELGGTCTTTRSIPNEWAYAWDGDIGVNPMASTFLDLLERAGGFDRSKQLELATHAMSVNYEGNRRGAVAAFGNFLYMWLLHPDRDDHATKTNTMREGDMGLRQALVIHAIETVKLTVADLFVSTTITPYAFTFPPGFCAHVASVRRKPCYAYYSTGRSNLDWFMDRVHPRDNPGAYPCAFIPCEWVCARDQPNAP